ncbi:MAG: aldo/keto reductase [Pseudomonadales bacterium]|jgi:aryl-alcohol dehydrogenase-like predicted oxidoreductase|nr:aldo/keto reductase [Pseudomonadales bacterium]MDP6473197.1 aldo/keto reductase [Pseudomonadales bacterium]MDP6826043.1 aldo/keto reductase [Pseudomonadales bacterium]MDP6973242.1 aldo/keto reductase [Pseudomonadales bacterium]|tara:strand:- start:1769 stop:2644 length:876 start_codon:yes stop_codon:yes gene_type:complete
MIERIPFGNTGHDSSRIIFGAAALGGMKQARADATLDLVLEHGVNHIDTAASYGDSELRLAPFLSGHRDEFFLATKTGERTAAGARDSLHRSLERMGVDRVDMIQMHNLVDEDERAGALAAGGALEALIEAKAQGLTRFIGVTGHGTWVAAAHLMSLAAYSFDAVLAPYSFALNASGPYSVDFERLYTTCRENKVAIQTIKSVARRRWCEEDDETRFSWYMPLRDADSIRRAVHFVLAREGLFLNSSSDTTILPLILSAASERPQIDETGLRSDLEDMEPIFVRGKTDEVR